CPGVGAANPNISTHCPGVGAANPNISTHCPGVGTGNIVHIMSRVFRMDTIQPIFTNQKDLTCR
ncbi:MAG: hypothetical protein ACP5SH_24385, partial [Syntrophobacteraceae bacterium]